MSKNESIKLEATNNELAVIESEVVNSAISTMSNLVADSINHKIEVINTPDGTKYAVSLATPTKNGNTKLECYDIAIVNEIATLQGLDTISETSETLKCAYLAKSAKTEIYKSLGFSDIYDFASHVFGYARATAFQYMRVGLVFIDYDKENKPTMWSFLPSTFTKTHLSEILNAMPSEWVAKHDDIIEHVDDIRKELKALLTSGTLNANMSASAIRKALDGARGMLNEDGSLIYNLKPKKASKASKGVSEASEASETDENENDIIPDSMTDVIAKASLIKAKKSLEVVLSYITTRNNGEVMTGTLESALEKITTVIADLDNIE